jgi:4'-phosphopantetheinyl transferase
VRTVLSQYIDVSPQSWSFLANAYGKPEIATPSAGRSLRFSVANTDGLVTCAVALDRDIGVDAEVIDSTVETEEIADRFFARAEVSDLRALPPDERPYRFFEFWTLKESYIKARGLGLSLPLEKFAFVVQRRRSIEVVFDPSIVDDQGLVEDPRNWHFSLLQPIKSHLIAVALGRLQTEARVSWREAIELTINPLKQFAYGAVPFSSSWDSPTDATGRPSPMVTRSRTPLGCDVTARGAME